MISTLENFLNRHIAWFMTNGNKTHRISRYEATRMKDYMTRNERVRWLHKVIRSCETTEQLKAADRKSTRLNSSHVRISYAVFCLKKKNKTHRNGSAQGWNHLPDASVDR